MYAFGRLLWRARAGSRRTVAGCRPPPVDADHDLEEILANNKRWVAATNAADPTFFPKLAEGQSPQFLYVGCSDSRLVPNDMLGLGLGNLFVHRNVANLVVASDLNFLSVLTYAVEHLDVKHVLVTGHYDCGGVRAAMKNRGLGASSESVSSSSAKNELELDELDAAAPMASTRCRAASTPSTRPSESLLSRGRRSAQDYKKWMIAVHLGLMFNALFTVVFCVQYLRSRGDPEKASRAFLFMVMTAGSALSMWTLVKLKPKPKKD